MPEQKAPDSLDGALHYGTDAMMAAKGAYDTARGIGAASAEAGVAAASGAASAGAGVGASAGTGAAVGTAVGGPVGTALGAVGGLVMGLLAKPLVKAAIVIAAFIFMVFCSLPSMFWEKPVDVADNTGPLEIYVQYRDCVYNKYQDEMESTKEKIEDDFERRISTGEFNDYDYVEYSYSFIPTEDVFLSQLMDSSTLIVSLFEIGKDDWRKSSFNDFKSAVNSVYFWNGTILCLKDSEEREVTREYNREDDEYETTVHVSMTYTLEDAGVAIFREKFGVTDDGNYLKAVEMAFNTKYYFGETDELPMGGITGGGSGTHPGGGGSGTYPGGGTHNTIRQALTALTNPQDFFGGSAIVPLPSGSWFTTSEFGPRNYAPDPIHTGLDFGAASGTSIYSAMDGIILLKLTNARTFGHHIVVYHGGNITTMYAHMSAFGSYNVGDTVRKGDVIGYVGKTGLSEGYHLHFEYQIRGSAYNPRLILPI